MELNERKLWLYGLLVACPEGKPLPDCPLEKYREGSNKDKFAILENMEEEVEEIIKHHHQCVLRRV